MSFHHSSSDLPPISFFQPQIYRADGDTVLLPPGEFELTYNRGPEYKTIQKKVFCRCGQRQRNCDFSAAVGQSDGLLDFTAATITFTVPDVRTTTTRPKGCVPNTCSLRCRARD